MERRFHTMAKFLIEAPHEAEKVACARAVQVFMMSGSHFLTNADWGCSDGEHKAWIVLEMESKEDARSVLPPSFRPQAKVVRLNRFTMQEVDDIIRYHQGQS
jgi:hypothetical protein